MDLDALRKKMPKAKAGPAPEPEGDEPPVDEAKPDEAKPDEMKQKLIDAVTTAIESCFAT